MKRKIWHISVQGNGRQSMFLTNGDILHAINLLGVLSTYYDVDVLAYAFMSNHFHLIIQCEDPQYFMKAFRLSYTKYHNSVHNVIGSVGSRSFKAGLLNTRKKLVEKLIYVIRNTVRHRLQSHPYADPYNSAKFYFAEEQRIKWYGYKPAGQNTRLMHSHKMIPEYFLVDKNENILPLSFIKFRKVEACFQSYAQFMSLISNPTEKELAEEEARLSGGKARQHEGKARQHEGQRNYMKNTCVAMTDLQLSEKIINDIKPRSIASLSDAEVVAMARYYRNKYPVSLRQLSRIFALPESTLRLRMQKRFP